MCCKPLTTLSPDQWLLNHQGSVLAPYGSPPTANRWPHWWGFTPLQRCSRRILQPQPIGRHMVWVLFTAFGICVVLYRHPCSAHIFGIWNASETGRRCSTQDKRQIESFWWMFVSRSPYLPIFIQRCTVIFRYFVFIFFGIVYIILVSSLNFSI